MTLEEIGNRFGVVKSTIATWMEKHDIERRTKSEHIEMEAGDWRDKDVLQELYWKEGMSTPEIGEELGTHGAVVAKWMRKLGVPRRSKKEAMRKRYSGSMTLQRDDSGRARLFISHGEGDTTVITLAKVIALLEYDAEKVFSKQVHHRNECPYDDRIENYELLTTEEHARHHDNLRS